MRLTMLCTCITLVLHMSVGATWFPFQFGANLHLRRAWVLRSRPLDPLSQRRAYTQNDPNKRTESANMHGSGTGRGKGCGRGCGHLGGPKTRIPATGGQFLPRGARCRWRGEAGGPPVPRCREAANNATQPDALCGVGKPPFQSVLEESEGPEKATMHP